MTRFLLGCFLIVVLSACPEPTGDGGQSEGEGELAEGEGEISEGEGEGVEQPRVLSADIDVDTNRDGAISVSDDEDEDTHNTSHGAVFIANVDDDDGDAERDSRDAVINGDVDLDDMTTVLVKHILEMDGHTVTLTLEPEEARTFVRIWQRVDGELLQLFDPENPIDSTQVPGVDAADVELLLEGLVARIGDWDGTVDLTLTLRDSGGTELNSDRVRLRGAPVVLPDNLQTPQTLYVMGIGNGLDNNVAFVDAMQNALPGGVTLYDVSEDSYGADRWVQDNMELGYQEKPTENGGRAIMRTALNLRRGGFGRGLEGFVPEEYVGPGAGYFNMLGSASSHNYGGNLEVAPPVDGFPLGRILYGGGDTGGLLGRPNSDRMNDSQLGFLQAQEVQGVPLELSSEWLAVGHIDEIFQFVPDLTPTDGAHPFKVVIASPELAREALLAVQERGNGQMRMFAERENNYSVDEVLAAEEFAAVNEAATERINAVKQLLMSELSLVEEDFAPVPVFYWDVGDGLVAAFNPGIQNLVTVGNRLFVPDPEGPRENGVDVWQEATLAALADTDLDVVFVDVFYSYHELLGEAHCGTNLDRAPFDMASWTTSSEQP